MPSSKVGFVSMSPELRCAARLHATDMAEQSFFDSVNPAGEDPASRMTRAGHTFRLSAEVLAESSEPPYALLQQLLAAGGADCEALLDPRFSAAGVGVFAGLWVIDLAGP